MKNYILSILAALIIGIIIGKFFLEQYEAYDGIKLSSNEGEILYFIRYGIYNTKEEMDKGTLSLVNYVYNNIGNKYYVYIGITKEYDNLIKLNNYYSELGYQTITEEFLVTNKEFLEELVNFDSILANTNDSVVISAISSLTLEKYEVIVNGSED